MNNSSISEVDSVNIFSSSPMSLCEKCTETSENCNCDIGLCPTFCTHPIHIDSDNKIVITCTNSPTKGEIFHCERRKEVGTQTSLIMSGEGELSQHQLVEQSIDSYVSHNDTPSDEMSGSWCKSCGLFSNRYRSRFCFGIMIQEVRHCWDSSEHNCAMCKVSVPLLAQTCPGFIEEGFYNTVTPLDLTGDKFGPFLPPMPSFSPSPSPIRPPQPTYPPPHSTPSTPGQVRGLRMMQADCELGAGSDETGGMMKGGGEGEEQASKDVVKRMSRRRLTFNDEPVGHLRMLPNSCNRYDMMNKAEVQYHILTPQNTHVIKAYSKICVNTNVAIFKTGVWGDTVMYHFTIDRVGFGSNYCDRSINSRLSIRPRQIPHEFVGIVQVEIENFTNSQVKIYPGDSLAVLEISKSI